MVSSGVIPGVIAFKCTTVPGSVDEFKNGVLRVTAIGRRYFKEHPVQYTVMMPIRVIGRNARGEQYERDARFPVNVTTDIHRSDPNFVETLKELAIAIRGLEWNMSGEDWEVNREGSWNFSEMRYQDGHMIAANDIPLRGDPNCHSWLAHPSCLGDEAFGVGECVPRQLSKRMGMSMQFLTWEFAEIARELYVDGKPPFFEEWTMDLGVSSRMIEALCRKHEWHCHAVFMKELVSRYVGCENPRGSIVYSFHQGHFFLYDEDTAAVHAITKWKATSPLRPIMRSVDRLIPCLGNGTS